MATKVLAVSGGVDSVVLLDMFSKTDTKVIVAHVDHGIRDDSACDARFVNGLAEKYGYKFEMITLKLGEDASEETAREKRYEFLFNLAKKYSAAIVTAHHGDDLAETVAINLHRGTGWRGLAVLNRGGVERPLLGYSKADLYRYALKYGLEWVEDKTNRDRRYLRNQIRARLGGNLTAQARNTLLELRSRQVQLATQILQETKQILTQNDSLRYLLSQLNSNVATEIISTLIEQKTGYRPTGPQLERARIAISVAAPHSIHHVGGRVLMRFSTRGFSVEVLK